MLQWRENELAIQDYFRLRESVGWLNFDEKQTEKGKESFYEKLGFKQLPHEYCGPGMRKVIYKKE